MASKALFIFVMARKNQRSEKSTLDYSVVPGFVQVVSDTESHRLDYRGNGMFQSFGNLAQDSRAALPYYYPGILRFHGEYITISSKRVSSASVHKTSPSCPVLDEDRRRNSHDCCSVDLVIWIQFISTRTECYINSCLDMSIPRLQAQSLMM